MRITKPQNWEFKGVSPGDGYPQYFLPRDAWRPASVPGHVHLDLMHHGIIADPFIGQAELGCQWVDDAAWSYRTQIHFEPDAELPKRMLVFEGLDTASSIFLNGQLLGTHDNMFLPLELDVSNKLNEGMNELRVEFQPAKQVGLERRRAYFQKSKLDWQTGFFDERAFVRKAQYMSGWDWGPRLISCGIWKPVSLLEYSGRILQFQVHAERLDSGAFRVWSETTVEGDGNLITSFDDEQFEGDFDFVVVQPELWWPNGYGEQHLYVADVEFAGHKLQKKIGLRTIKLIREPDKNGESFEFEVNERRIWARGANWIPNDSFPSRIQDHDVEDSMKACAELNFNMLRVWGGGMYESEAFYDACDRRGILVWQDFPFACSYCPEDAGALEQSRLEAEHQVKRLRHHASLAIWCGNNENLAMHEQKWAGETAPIRMHGQVIFEEELPELLAKLDPRTPYIATSPIGPTSGVAPCNDGGAGDQHYWDVWHGRGDWKHYAESTARFASEFGFPSSCSLEQWEEVLRDDHWDTEHDSVRWHDKTGKPFEKWLEMVELHYPKAQTLDEWVYFSQLNQRDALRCAIEHYRTSEFCKGTLIWQFNDCWPAQSWAVQDYLRLLKPAGEELRRLYAPLLLAATPSKHGVGIWAVNDRTEPQTFECSVCLYTPLSSRSESIQVDLQEGQRKCVHRLETQSIDAHTSFAAVEVPGEPGLTRWILFCEPKQLRLGQPTLSYEVLGNRLDVHVTGVAFDAFVMDSDDRSNLRPMGNRVQTLMNGALSFEFDRKPRKLLFQSLAGCQELEIG